MLMLAGIVHSVDLGHAVGQVTEETRSDLGVYTFAGGQEPGDFIHALAETGAIFSQDSGVGVQGRCREDRRVSPECSHEHLVLPMQFVKIYCRDAGLFAGLLHQSRHVLKSTVV